MGDTLSAPLPSFAGHPIKDIVIHNNRLCFLSDTNVVASEAAGYFNFWPTTVTELVDSDPFDISATGNRTSYVEYAVPLGDGLSLFSPVGDTISELVGSRDEPLTVTNARIEERSALPSSNVRPADAGARVYFALDRGSRTSIFEYTQQDYAVFGTTDVTSHCPDYLPNGVYRLAPGRAENTLAVLTTEERNVVFIYRYWYEGDDQLMSSWSEFVIDESAVIVDVGWNESKLYLFIHRQDGLHFEVLDFGKVEEADDYPHRVHLDSLVKVTGTYDIPSDTTTWTVPYDQTTNGGEFRAVTSEEFGTGGDGRGQVLTIDYSTDTTFTATGDWTAGAVYFGRVYESSYEFSEIVLRYRSRSGDVGSSDHKIDGRLQLKRGHLVYEDTGYFEAQITSRDPDDTEVYVAEFTAESINESVFGPRAIETGVFEFDIAGRSNEVVITIKSDAVLPFTISALTWEGRFYQRATQA